MAISNRRLIKIISLITAFAFFFANTGFAEILDYVPFDETQQESDYLTIEQLDNFRDTKQSLVDKHNAANTPPLTAESEIIQFLYDLMNPGELANLNVLQNSYETAKSEREAAQDNYNDIKEELKDYYVEEENARLNIWNVLDQIETFTQRLNSVLEEKENTDQKLLSLENTISTKRAALQNGQLDEIASIESDLSNLKSYLNTLNAQKAAATEEKNLYDAEQDLIDAQSAFDASLALVHQELGNNFDLDTSPYTKIFDTNSNLIDVRLTPRDQDKEAVLLDALLKQETLNDANDTLDQLKSDYNTAHPLSDADTALNEYKALLVEIPTVEENLKEKEIDLVSKDEAVRTAEIEINNIQTEIDTTNSKYSLLATTADALMDQIDSFNGTKIRLEEEERQALAMLEQAEEAALKFKETSAIHAEAFSGAEVLHGPFGLVRKDYPLLLFPQNDASLEGMLELAKKIRSLGAETLMSAPQGLLAPSQLAETASISLPLPESLNPLCDPLMVIQAFYVMVARLAVKRGYDPDSPDNLKKVTKTT